MGEYSLNACKEFLLGGAPVQLVTTTDYEWPNESNTTPLRTVGTGRGSIVLYNQASFSHWLVTGHRTMKKAEAVHGGQVKVKELFAEKARKVLQFRQD